MKRLFIVCLTAVTAVAVPCLSQEDTWLSRRGRAQLAMDPVLIPKGKGMLFVPTMTTGYREPNYQIHQDGDELAEAETGTGVLLDPGSYELVIGSGTIAQMMRRPVEIHEGHTTLVRPWWSGLVIDVIDETRASVKEPYELFDAEQENYGVGYGVEEERGEAVNTWLLKPGTYMIVRVGESIATPHKFSVRLLPGELAQRNLVVDSNNIFIGFYPPGYLERGRETASRWNSRWELSMSPQFNATQNTAGEDKASLSFSGQIRNRTRYNGARHFVDLRLTLEEGFTKEAGDALRKSVDEVQVRSTYILRLARSLGPYLRGVLNTKLFPTDVRFDVPQDLTLRSSSGDVIETRRNVTEFTQEPSVYPLNLREGVGINSQLYRSFPLNVDVRIGLGARQTVYMDVYELSQDKRTATELSTTSTTGLETLLILDARLSEYISLDSELDVLMPSATTDSWEFAFENRLRTFLTPFINMDIVLNFERKKPLKRLQSAQQVLLRLVKFF